MKRVLYCLIIIVSLVIAARVFVKPVVLAIARRQIAKVFIDSSISIRSCEWAPFHQIRFLDIALQRDGVYDIKLQEADIHYNLPDIFQKTVRKIVLKNGSIILNLPRKNISEVSRYLNLGSEGVEGRSFSGDLELGSIDVDVKVKDITCKASVSMTIGLEQQVINAVDLDMSLLKIRGARFDDVGLKVDESLKGGEFTAGKVQYDKLKLANVKGAARLKDNILYLDAVSAGIFEGKVFGQGTFKISLPPEYLVDFQLMDLDLKEMVDDFELKKKFQMSGLAAGQLILRGTGSRLDILSGDFTVGTGGVLVIKDTRFIENIAQNTHQPADLLVESFKDYHYNTGAIKLSLKKKDLVLDMVLDGEAGKRDLNITVHEFILKKDGL
jgi:hypothetical protein